MKVKATLYIQKTVWIEEEVEVDIPAAQSSDDTDEIIDAVENAFNDWVDNQSDSGDISVSYELDDYGYETVEDE
jgi:hypothetical protein